mmetsp:Transcript_35134/g.53872  ORF Transcript_35134/g.53872 Transcript_35134/m.53872 type:complete len:219 (+) Transcript_35134:3302-3958(+)
MELTSKEASLPRKSTTSFRIISPQQLGIHNQSESSLSLPVDPDDKIVVSKKLSSKVHISSSLSSLSRSSKDDDEEIKCNLQTPPFLSNEGIALESENTTEQKRKSSLSGRVPPRYPNSNLQSPEKALKVGHRDSSSALNRPSPSPSVLSKKTSSKYLSRNRSKSSMNNLSDSRQMSKAFNRGSSTSILRKLSDSSVSGSFSYGEDEIDDYLGLDKQPK